MPAHPFISYAREDRPIAEKLYHDLRTRGAVPWLDVEDLIGGENWPAAITRAIQAASHFIALLSTHSVNKRGFVQRELRHALDVLQQFPPDDVFVVPVRLDDSRPRDERLSQLHWIDLFPDYEVGFRRLAKSLRLEVAANESTPPHPLNPQHARRIDTVTYPVGRTTLAIVRDVFGAKSGWTRGKKSSRYMFAASYVVTNIADHPIQVVRVQAQIDEDREDAAIVRFLYPGRSQHELETIPPGASRQMAITFFGNPSGLRQGREIGLDIVFVDQFGNENWLRGERFAYRESLP